MRLFLYKKIQQKKVNLVLRILNLLVASLIMILLCCVAANGFASLPALGPTLNPLTGVWNSEQGALLPQTETLPVSGSLHSVIVTFEKNGTPHIQAQDDADLFRTMGYLQARSRLFQMDLLRRQGEGLLSQILGSSVLSSDRFEDSVGLLTIAQAQWDGLSSSSPARQGLLSYTEGVNAGIQQDEQTHTLPAMFRLLNYHPQPWTPIDSLVVEGVMTQTLSFFNTPLEYALLSNSLGYQRTMQWFPVLPANTQHPYDNGPYTHSETTPLAAQNMIDAQDIQSLASVARQLASLPANAIRHDSSSNSWAINGPKSASGQALLAGDPHLNLSLPSIWFQVEGNSPHYSFNGVTIPGLPIILMGKNKQISWSITDGQSQSTIFYLEKTDSAHPNQYYWNGAWRPMKQATYTIPIQGEATVHFEVRRTVHGPILSEEALPGKSVAVDWMGALPSEEIDALFKLAQATNFTEFRDTLREWVAPTLNFVYADTHGHIGLVAPGAYPIVKSGSPWLPLAGTGESDVTGMIPFNDLPQIYDPPSHFIVTSNQRPVNDHYPYYIGTSLDFENGYRANEIYAQLNSGNHFTMQDMENLQNSTQDYLAKLILPKLFEALKGRHLSKEEEQAYTFLKSWDGNMQANAVAPTLWWTFWNQYLVETFQPWWTAQHVPVNHFQWLGINADVTPLDEDLETWTLQDPTNPAFSLPTGGHRTASDVMVKALQDTLPILSKKLGSAMQQWQWGKVNVRTIPSLTYIPMLGYGPVPSSGDDWTVSAADYYASIHGPSWRVIVDWASGHSESIYPGGESEDPLSPWYQNGLLPWLHGQYYPMLSSNDLKHDQKKAIWTLQP